MYLSFLIYFIALKEFLVAKIWLFFRFLITIAAFSLTLCACISLSTSKQPDFITTVDEYQKLVPENLVKYSHMIVSVTGKLRKVDFYGGYRAVLGGSKETIDCIFAKTKENKKILSGLQTGQTVSIIGETVVTNIQTPNPRAELRKCSIK
jgi:hypothetical protein